MIQLSLFRSVHDTQSGLVCLEEIDHMKQRDLNQLKAITTMRTINERRCRACEAIAQAHRHSHAAAGL